MSFSTGFWHGSRYHGFKAPLAFERPAPPYSINVEQKTKKPGRYVPDDEVGGQSVVLFATEVAQRSAPISFTGKKDHECLARSTIRVEEVFNWFFPTQTNIGQLQCKAYARLELGFSKTLPTLTFFPSQIREVPDILADGTVESTSFLERGQRLKEHFDPQNPKVMNDGCSRMSVEAARQIARDLGLAERPPSVFQARIGSWKGIWMVDVEKSPDKPQSDTWIEVTPSQRKFNRHAEDLEDDTFDPMRTTFEVITWSMSVTSARLSPTLIPILVDRRVPEQALHDIFQTSLAYERKKLMMRFRTRTFCIVGSIPKLPSCRMNEKMPRRRGSAVCHFQNRKRLSICLSRDSYPTNHRILQDLCKMSCRNT